MFSLSLDYFVRMQRRCSSFKVMMQHSMDPESVQTRVVAVSVVGQNVQFYEGESCGGGILNIKHLDENIDENIVGI